MNGTIDLTGVVLYARPQGEFDKRVVILTRERGKITAFARGARRQNSPLLATCNPMVFATFHLSEGRSAYSLYSADVAEYFTSLSLDIPGAWYAFYFLELASYYGREGLQAGETVNLIYVALKALSAKMMPLDLIRAVYELRIMLYNGDFAVPENENMSETVRYALHFCTTAKVTELFSFKLTPEAEKEFIRIVRRELRRTVDRPMKSLEVIEKLKT